VLICYSSTRVSSVYTTASKLLLFLHLTGDLHDGTGLTDARKPDGEKALPIFDKVEYDLLTIGRETSTPSPTLRQAHASQLTLPLKR